MALIEDRSGSDDVKNSGYYRLFDNDITNEDIAYDIAQIISKTQGAVISNGSILEHFLIDKRFNKNDIKLKSTVDMLLEANDGHYPKIKFKKDVLRTKGINLKGKNAIEVDYIVIKDGEIFVYEIKDGDAFDTKKSEAEYQSLLTIQKFLIECNKFKTVHIGIVLWNSNDLSKASFKSIKGKDILMRGKDFCVSVDIDYDSLNSSRKYNNMKNINYILNNMNDIRVRFLAQQTQIDQLEKLQIEKDKLLLLDKKNNVKRIQANIDHRLKTGKSLIPVLNETSKFVSEAETRNKIKKLAETDTVAKDLLIRMRSSDGEVRTLALSNAKKYLAMPKQKK